MSITARRLRAPLALVTIAASAALGACRADAKHADSTALGADSALSRDLAMANRDSTAEPQLRDVPVAAPEAPAPTTTSSPRKAPRPRPVTPKPKSPPVSKPVTTPSGNVVTTNTEANANPAAAGGGAVGTIPAGATLNTNASSRVCTNTNQVGDHVTATVETAVAGANGAVIPAGATVNMTVTRLKRSENANDPVVLEFAVNSVTVGGKTYPIEAEIASAAVDRVKDQPKGKDAQKVAIGAAAGAIAGRIFGKSTKATVIGGAAGAAAGAATAAATSNYQGCIPMGGSIVVKLTAPATVRA